MGINAKDGYYDLKKHLGHKIVIVGYGGDEDGDWANIAIECEDCNEVLVDFDQPIHDEDGKCELCGQDCCAFLVGEGDDTVYCENEQCENGKA